MLKRLTLKAYSITVTLPLFVASVAHDHRTASADGYSSLIPSLPHSTTVEQPAAPFLPTPHSLAEVSIEEIGTRRLELDPHARDHRARLELLVPELDYLLGPTPQSSDATRIAVLTTAHHHIIPIKHRSYPNTVNYYLDSTNYRLSKTKTIKLTQRLAEFYCMLAFHSFQSCSGCLEYKHGIAQCLSSYARSLFCIVVVGIASSADSLGGRLGSRSALG